MFPKPLDIARSIGRIGPDLSFLRAPLGYLWGSWTSKFFTAERSCQSLSGR
jgi:hypothetical protein